MNDRELLELAAKAAGNTITDWCAGRRGADWAAAEIGRQMQEGGAA